MSRPLMLSSGEFAKICHISRELLIHYDRIGLLKPKEIKSNGYRYYSIKQLYLFDAIRFLLDAGMSTKDVRSTCLHVPLRYSSRHQRFVWKP